MTDAREPLEPAETPEDDLLGRQLDRPGRTEAQWRRSRFRSEASVALGGFGLASTSFLLFWALQGWGYLYTPFVVLAVVAAVAAGLPSLGLVRSGVIGIRNPRALPPPARRGELEGEPESKLSERQLLEAIERKGEITPARAALETDLSVEEAERALSRLAERGHLDVRVEGGRLVYSL